MTATQTGSVIKTVRANGGSAAWLAGGGGGLGAPPPLVKLWLWCWRGVAGCAWPPCVRLSHLGHAPHPRPPWGEGGGRDCGQTAAGVGGAVVSL